MAHIDYFLFPISPFTYLAGNGIEDLAAKHGATLTYKPFGLMRIFEATGTLPPAMRHPSRQAHRLQELERIAAFNKMPINPKPAFFPTNPVPAMSAIITAQDTGGIERNTNEALERGVFGAPTYLVDDQVFWGQDRLAHLDIYLAG